MKQPQFSLLLLVLSIVLAMVVACAGLTPRQKIGISCDSAAAALDTLTAAKQSHKISADQLNDAIAIYERGVIPVCKPLAPNADAVKKAAFAAAAAELAARAGGVR